MSVNHRNAIITGARTGIGKALLEKFAEKGINSWAIIHRQDDEFIKYTQELQGQYNVWISIIIADLSKEEDIRLALQSIIKTKERIDILINAAGVVSVNRLIQMTSLQDMHHVMNVNFFAPIMISQLVSRVMCKQKEGVILNISSASVWDVDLAQLEYIASKAALSAATKKMAREWGEYNIRVNAIAPGLTETKMLDNMDSTLKSNIINKTSLKKLAQVDDIVNLCMFLVDNKSKYITGQIYKIDGGM